MAASSKQRWDRQLVELFLEGFNHEFEYAFKVREWPEDTESAKRSGRPSEAIEAVAEDARTGETLGLEHTLLPPFQQEKWHDKRSQAVFAGLESNSSLVVPGFHVTVGVPVGAIPKRQDLTRISEQISRWIRTNITEKIATEGPWPDNLTWEPDRDIPNLGFPLRVDVRKQQIAGHPGVLHFIGTYMPQTLPQEVERALVDKVPKLSLAKFRDAPVSFRLLLLEQDSPPYTMWEIARELEAVIARLRSRLPQLSAIHSIWLADTRDSRPHMWFCKIWPGGVGASFSMKNPKRDPTPGEMA
ncbi:MAG: hypothetical protein ACLQOO_03415 [Terriglobia bacterium]